MPDLYLNKKDEVRADILKAKIFLPIFTALSVWAFYMKDLSLFQRLIVSAVIFLFVMLCVWIYIDGKKKLEECVLEAI